MWGRWIGALLGLLFFKNIFIALLGFFVGYQIDKKMAGLSMGSADNTVNAIVKTRFLPVLFACMGYMAKVDGRISEDEIEHAENIMKHYGFDLEKRQQAIQWFKSGAENTEQFWRDLQLFAQQIRFRLDVKKLLLELVISMAVVDGGLHAAEEQALLKIAKILGFNEKVLRLLLGQFSQQSGASKTNAHSLDQAYKMLGVKESDDMAVIKKAYRKLMSEHHPDKLMAQGLPDEAIKMATEKSQMIQAAYEQIQKARGL